MAVILPSVYLDGTATVAANGTVVTGQGTLWLKAVLPGDFFGVHKGFPIRIASVDSNTQLTLANTYPGGAQTAAAYAIMLQSDQARVQETTRQFLEKMESGPISALFTAGIAADKFPYYNSASTAALGNLIAGTSLFSSVHIPHMSASDADGGQQVYITNNNDGNTATRGSVGLTADGHILHRWDGTAIFRVDNTGQMTVGTVPWARLPGYGPVSKIPHMAGNDSGTGDFCRITMFPDGTYATKGSFGMSTAGNWNITWNGVTTWNVNTAGTLTAGDVPPQRLTNSGVGTVSVSGGLPTGAILERGANANGDYAKYADGTLICWNKAATEPGNVNATNARLHGTWSYPHPFNSSFLPSVSAILPMSNSSEFSGFLSGAHGGRGAIKACGVASAGNTTTTSFSIYTDVGAVDPAVTQITNIHLMAIGRWY